MKKREYVKRPIQCSYHRNGVAGEGFHAVLFEPIGEAVGTGPMLAILFEGSGQCAVLSVPKLVGKEGVNFGLNSWRGDVFEPELRDEVEKWETRRRRG